MTERGNLSATREALAGVVDVIHGPDWLALAKSCQGHTSLPAHEARFVDQMVHLAAAGREPSPKQAKWLRDIYTRLRQRHSAYDLL
jgi:hypothetical protein